MAATVERPGSHHFNEGIKVHIIGTGANWNCAPAGQDAFSRMQHHFYNITAKEHTWNLIVRIH